MNLKTFLAAVRLYSKTFAAVTATVLAVGAALIAMSPARYVSTAQVMVSISGSTTAAAYQNDEVVNGRVNSYIALLTSDVVSQRVIDRLAVPLSAPELATRVNATRVPPNTSIIDIAVTGDSPKQARLLTDTFVAEFIAYAKALETPTGEDDQKVHVTPVTSASEPRGDAVERGVLVLLAAAAALLLGAAAVWIRSVTDPIVRTADQAAVAAGVPVLASFSGGDGESTRQLQGHSRLGSALRTTTPPTDWRVLAIVSVDGEADATELASHIVGLLQQSGQRCCTIDAAQPDRSDDPPGSQTATDSITAGDASGASSATEAIPSPACPVGPGAAGTAELAERIAGLQGEYDHLVITAPLVSADPASPDITEFADRVLILCALHRTKRRDLNRATERLGMTGAPLVGVVLGSPMPPRDPVVNGAPHTNTRSSVR